MFMFYFHHSGCWFSQFFFFLEMTSFWDQAESENQEGFTLCPPAWVWKTQVSQGPDTSWLQLRVQLTLEAPDKRQGCPVGQEHVERWGPQEVDRTGVALTGSLGCKQTPYVEPRLRDGTRSRATGGDGSLGRGGGGWPQNRMVGGCSSNKTAHPRTPTPTSHAWHRAWGWAWSRAGASQILGVPSGREHKLRQIPGWGDGATWERAWEGLSCAKHTVGTQELVPSIGLTGTELPLNWRDSCLSLTKEETGSERWRHCLPGTSLSSLVSCLCSTPSHTPHPPAIPGPVLFLEPAKRFPASEPLQVLSPLSAVLVPPWHPNKRPLFPPRSVPLHEACPTSTGRFGQALLRAP